MFDFGSVGFSSMERTRPTSSISTTPNRSGSSTFFIKILAPERKFMTSSAKSDSNILSARIMAMESLPAKLSARLRAWAIPPDPS